MTVKYAVLCDQVITSNTGTTSLIGIFERVAAPALPAWHTRMVFAIGLTFDPEDLDVRHSFVLTLLDPDGREMRKFDGQFELASSSAPSKPGAALNVPFMDVVFEKYGFYRVDVLLDGKPTVALDLELAERL